MKVYLIEGNSGEYEDYRTWVVGVYLTKALAEKACNDLNEWCKENGVFRGTLEGGYCDLKIEACSFNKTPDLDPEFQVDYTGSEYNVLEVRLLG